MQAVRPTEQAWVNSVNTGKTKHANPKPPSLGGGERARNDYGVKPLFDEARPVYWPVYLPLTTVHKKATPDGRAALIGIPARGSTA